MKIKEVIELLKTNPDSTLKSLKKEDIFKIINYLSDQYYNKNISMMSDQMFDIIKEFYETNFNEKINIGSKIKKGKVKLPYWMGSLDKIKSSTNAFNKWINDYIGPYVISYKLDGISALLYKNNNIVYMYTRGDGIEGQDISHCIKDMNINIKNLKNGDAIRGELIISKENFKKISFKMANARNAVSGIINTKNPDTELLNLIDFVAYWVLNPIFKISEQLEYIKKKNFKPESVEYILQNKITINNLSELLIEGRNNHKYEIDGLVVMDNSKYYPLENGENPSYGFAFKQLLTDQISEATVIDVIWQISKDKYIKPKIKINTIELGGVEITFATANNAKFIVDNNIGPGAIVQIVRSGDVIPKIEKVIKPAESGIAKMPSINYIWNETKVDIIAVNLNNELLDKIIVKKLAYFFTTLNIKFMAEATIEKFVLNGYNDLWKILLADKKNIEEIEGFGKTIVDKLYQSIDDGLKNRDLADIMAASQIFGRGIGNKKFKLILNNYPNIIDIYKKEGKIHTTQLINSIIGFDTKTTSKIVDNMDNFITYLNELIKLKPNLLKTFEQQNNILDNTNSLYNFDKFKNKTIVFTGFRDKNIEIELENIGAKISSSVSKNTDFVITENINDVSNKLTKAKQLEIKIISKNDFYKLIQK